jgi:cytochrome b561
MSASNNRKQSHWVRQWRNDASAFGWLAIVLHWSSAILVIGLLALGVWMVTLTYYDSCYTPAPLIHKSLGLLFAFLLLIQLVYYHMTGTTIIGRDVTATDNSARDKILRKY